MPRYYPIYLDLSRKVCLIVGGGAVAERKARGLLEADASVRVVSPTLTPALQALADQGRIEARLTPYDPAHLSDAWLVFAATDSREVNRRVAREATAAGIPVNVVDAPEAGSFIVPSVLRRGDLCISISTGGNNPMLAARLCDELEARFGPEYGDFVELLGRMRAYIKSKTDDPARRHQALAALLDAEKELREHLQQGQPEAAHALATSTVERALATDTVLE